MQRHQHRLHLPAVTRGYLGKPTTALVLFSSVIFLFLLGDAIMAYFAPVYIEEHLHNTFWTGIILSSSSIIGFGADIILGEWFKAKPLSLYIIWAGILAILYPLSFLALPPLVPVFFLSMAIWGIYYELILFGKFNFINHFLPHHQHELGWTVIGTFNDLAYLIGPLIAGLFIAQSFAISLTTAISFTCMGLFGFVFFRRAYKHRLKVHQTNTPTHVNFKEELMVWRLVLPRIWPVMLFIFILTAFDATMWSIGAILSENFIKQELPIGEALFIAYLLPSMFMGYAAMNVSRFWGKKRTAFIFGILGGLIYIVSGFMPTALSFVVVIFLAAMCTAIVWPEIKAVVEDYVERLGVQGNLMVSLENSTTSLAYVFGSIFAGYIATVVGEQQTFSVMGILLVLVALAGLIVMPRKVRLPQQKIQSYS